MRALVVGGGVAGLTISRALALRGIDVKVFERAAGPEARQDRGLGLWDVSQKCLVEVGLGEFLRQQAFFTKPASYRDVRGTWLSSCRSSEKNGRRVACIQQSHLLKALAGEGAARLDIGWNKDLEHMEQASNKVKVRFRDGTEEEGNILIGADGCFSTVRRLVFPDSKMAFTGKTCYSNIVDRPLGSLAFETLGRLKATGSPLRIAMVPLKGDRLFWFITVHGDREGPADVPVEVLEQLSSWHEPVPSILRSSIKQGGCKSGAILWEPVHELTRPLSSWSSGRAVLLGDACHPLSPNLAQGAALSIESAVKLADALAQSKGDHTAAFETHRRSMQERVRACARVTEFTKVLAKFPEASGFMSYVPRAINGFVFDAFLNHSLQSQG